MQSIAMLLIRFMVIYFRTFHAQVLSFSIKVCRNCELQNCIHKNRKIVGNWKIRRQFVSIDQSKVQNTSKIIKISNFWHISIYWYLRGYCFFCTCLVNFYVILLSGLPLFHCISSFTIFMVIYLFLRDVCLHCKRLYSSFFLLFIYVLVLLGYFGRSHSMSYCFASGFFVNTWSHSSFAFYFVRKHSCTHRVSEWCAKWWYFVACRRLLSLRAIEPHKVYSEGD